MEVFDTLNTPLPSSEKPIALTIGNFDGVHLGHQQVIKALADTDSKQLVVISFSNHPSDILGTRRSVARICSEEHKRKLFEQLRVDVLYQVPFTKELADQTPKEFLEAIGISIPFDHLVLGEDARLGKDRSGTPEVLNKLAEELDFHIQYVDDFELEGVRVSSSRIRQLIQHGDLKEASAQLGRPYSVIWGEEGGICLPPRNYYPCQFAGMNATAKVSHAGLEVNPRPSPGIEVKFK